MEGILIHKHHKVLVVTLVLVALFLPPSSSLETVTRTFHFNVEWKNITRLCHTKQLLTVNGEYPGPTIAINEGDYVQVNVTNSIANATTIHWHGVRQLRTGWADGPAYITQCPIKGGRSYTYKFRVVEQRGTLLWHAHYSWQRASVYGAFIIYPRIPYPFTAPPVHDQIPIILGEWWNRDLESMEREMMMYGGGPNSSDAYTINGLPGPLYPCSTQDTLIQTVESGKTYMLRIINAAMSDELYFAISNHTLTVVEIDATYVKPFTTTAIMLTPGQTTTLLLTTIIPHNYSSPIFAISARPFRTSVFPFDNSTAIGFLTYNNTTSNNGRRLDHHLSNDNLPKIEDLNFATQFSLKLRSLASPQFPCKVPQEIDKRVIITISLNLQDCPENSTCMGFNGKRYFASMNNQSFVRPSSISILESYHKKINVSEYSLDFPENPPNSFNYSGVDPLKENMNTEFGTKILALPYGTNLEIVLQDTGFLNVENHPIHVHGHNFFVVGQGIGNYNVEKDPGNYNLVDPPERNTVGVPKGGWAAIRLKADNPGVWFVHCHLEEHTTWGLAMAFVVKDGNSTSQSLLPFPQDFPSC